MQTYRSLFLFIPTIAILAAGCSNDIANATGVELKLISDNVELPEIQPNQNPHQKIGIELKNSSSNQKLQITSMELVNVEAGQFQWAGGATPSPFTIEPGRSASKQIEIISSSIDLKCPTPPSDVPNIYKDEYCGEIKITSNSKLDSNPGVKKGIGRVFLLYKGGKGHGVAQPASIKFNYPIKDNTYKATITISNQGKNPLKITEADFSNTLSGTLSIAESFPLTIPPSDNKKLTLTYAPTAEEQTEVTTQPIKLNLSTSQKPKNILQIDISITKEEAHFPRLNFSKTTFAFKDDNPINFTIENTGKESFLSFAQLRAIPFGTVDRTYKLKQEDTASGTQTDISFRNSSLPYIKVNRPNNYKLSFKTTASSSDKSHAQAILLVSPRYQQKTNNTLDFNFLHLITPIPLVLYGTATPIDYVQRFPSKIELPLAQNVKSPIVLFNRGEADASVTVKFYENENPSNNMTIVDEQDATVSFPTTIKAQTFKLFYLKHTNTGAAITNGSVRITTTNKFPSAETEEMYIDNQISVALKNSAEESSRFTLNTEPQSTSALVDQYYLLQLNGEPRSGNRDDILCTLMLTKRPDTSKMFFYYSISGESCYETFNFIPDVEGNYEFSFFVQDNKGDTAPLEIKKKLTVIPPPTP